MPTLLAALPTQSLTLPFVVAQDYTINNLSTASQTITAGQSITYNLSVGPVGTAYSNAVNLSCSAPLLPGACSVSPGTVSLLSGATAAVMTVTTTQAASGYLLPPDSRGIHWSYAAWVGLIACITCTLARTRRYNPALRLTLALALLMILLSCSSSGANGGSTVTTTTTGTPVTYTITVVGGPSQHQPTQWSVGDPDRPMRNARKKTQ